MPTFTVTYSDSKDVLQVSSPTGAEGAPPPVEAVRSHAARELSEGDLAGAGPPPLPHRTATAEMNDFADLGDAAPPSLIEAATATAANGGDDDLDLGAAGPPSVDPSPDGIPVAEMGDAGPPPMDRT